MAVARVHRAQPQRAVFERARVSTQRSDTSDLCRVKRLFSPKVVNTRHMAPRFRIRRSSLDRVPRFFYGLGTRNSLPLHGTAQGDNGVIECPCRTRSRRDLEPQVLIVLDRPPTSPACLRRRTRCWRCVDRRPGTSPRPRSPTERGQKKG